jgi:acetyl-CoA C-acetyltransferase
MTAVVIAGLGQTPVGEHWGASLRDLALEVIRDAISDSGGLHPQALFVGNMLAPNLSNQAHLGVLLADSSDLAGIEAVTVEAAGASGGAALRQGFIAVASGMVDVALVVGVEKFTDRVGAEVEAALGTAADGDYESIHGLTPTAQAAMLMQRYLHEFNAPRDAFAGFALTAHANGEGNPNAMFRTSIKPESYTRAPVVSGPLNQFDIAPNSDGAAAVVLTLSNLLPNAGRVPTVRIGGSAAAIDTLAMHDRQDVLKFDSCRLSAGKALHQADVSQADIDLFEYHDAYCIYAALALEAVGFAEPGQGWKLAANGEIARQGRIPTATMGGLKARGFPGGATGVYQAVEAVLQLRGQAGVNQIPDATCALIQSMGGPGSTVVTHILQSGG